MTTPTWIDPYSPEGIRQATAHILTGVNYRVFYEKTTRLRLIEAYRELREIANSHPQSDKDWRASIKEILESGSSEYRNLRHWLVGLTRKTAQNLEIPVEKYPALFDEIMEEIQSGGDSGRADREMALLLWCGTATLTIRGSAKAKTGKALEKSMARAALTVIGLRESEGDFRLNVEADAEVDRETDAEIRTKRGFIRMEVGLIGAGNSEVISDKVGRMHRNGIIMLDILPNQSTAYQTAEHRGVCLIQIRNNNPVEELRLHLDKGDFSVPVQKEPITHEEVKARVLRMPLERFQTSTSPRSHMR